jgi:hypothetical protein
VIAVGIENNSVPLDATDILVAKRPSCIEQGNAEALADAMKHFRRFAFATFVLGHRQRVALLFRLRKHSSSRSTQTNIAGEDGYVFYDHRLKIARLQKA